jgi:hypothetical protein
VSSKAAVIVLIFHLPLAFDINTNGPAYIRDVLAANVFKVRKVEDGCVDIYFYDWHYFGSYTSSRHSFLFCFPINLIILNNYPQFFKVAIQVMLWLYQRQVVIIYFTLSR